MRRVTKQGAVHQRHSLHEGASQWLRKDTQRASADTEGMSRTGGIPGGAAMVCMLGKKCKMGSHPGKKSIRP